MTAKREVERQQFLGKKWEKNQIYTTAQFYGMRHALILGIVVLPMHLSMRTAKLRDRKRWKTLK